MKNLPVLVVLVALAWFGYDKYKSMHAPAAATMGRGSATATLVSQSDTPAASRFRCDGRTYCSQMHSCAEATYFIQHCPDTKMDGDHDGVPCEQQWCK